MYITVMMSGPTKLRAYLNETSSALQESFAERFRLTFQSACQKNLPLTDILIQYSNDPDLAGVPGGCHLYKIDVKAFATGTEEMTVIGFGPERNNQDRLRDDLALEFGRVFAELLLEHVDQFATVISQADFRGLTSTHILKKAN